MARRSEIGRGGTRHRRTPFFRVLSGLFGLVLLATVAAAGLGIYGYRMLQAEGPLSEPKVVVVETGTGTNEIGRLLAKEGVVRNGWLFVAGARALAALQGGVIKAGEYEVPARSSALGVIELLRSGKTLFYKLSVPEGFTTEQALSRVLDHEKLEGELTLQPPEGALLPDTYVFRRGMTRDRLVRQMMDVRDRLLGELWSGRAKELPLRSMEEAVILASIVEKETGIPEERPDVAAVFINRLRAGMRLQSDPTIIYGIVGGKGKLDRPIRRSDIDARTAYNTYQIDGLPPTPIANPGREAIAAVLNPSDSKALYFVADGTGGHVFANTLGEHQVNVRSWRNIEREQRAAEEASAAVAGGDDGDGTPPPEPAAKAQPSGAETGAPEQEAARDIGKAVDQPPLPIPEPDASPATSAGQAPAAEGPEPAAAGPATDTTTTATMAPAPQPKPVDLPLIEAADPRALVKVAGRDVPLPRPRPAVR